MAQFEFDGRSITVIPPRELTLGDLGFIKEHFGLSGQVELEDGLANFEPASWRALLVNSVRRVQPDVSPTHGDFDGVVILPLMEQMNEERAAAIAAMEDEKESDAARPTGRSSTRGRSGGRK